MSARAADDELRRILEPLLRAHRPEWRGIARLERRPSPYASSYPLEQLEIHFSNGESLQVIFKDISPAALPTMARLAKPAFLIDPWREIEIYRAFEHGGQGGRSVGHEFGMAVRYGDAVDEEAGRFWIFLEKVAGRELYQVGEFKIWKEVARWLARFHAQHARREDLSESLIDRLVRYDAAYFAQWLGRARGIQATLDSPLSGEAHRFLNSLAKSYPSVVDEIIQLPIGLIHGEFYASNILIEDRPRENRICAIDWECAGRGPNLLDVAALTAGGWSDRDRTRLAREYFQALPAGSLYANFDALLRGLELCRLHLAVQWLGWSADWTPPEAHRQNWLATAQDAATRLGVFKRNF